MNIKRSFASFLSAAIFLACANESHAQYFPLSAIGWSSSAPLCQILPGSAASFDNYSAPSSVSFAANSFGTIGLICNVNGIMNGLRPGQMNGGAFTFSNPDPFSGCTASVQLVDRTTATPVYAWTSDTGYIFSGMTTIALGSPGLSMDPTHTYDVEMYLYRPKSPSGKNQCNPIAYAAYIGMR